MEKPKSNQDFYNLIKSMEHRERFVFKTSKKREMLFMEIYCTEVDCTRGLEMNINFQYVNSIGKHEAGTSKRSILFRLIDINWLSRVYDTLR